MKSRCRGQNSKTECTLCDAECDSVVHVLWECPAYKDSRDTFMIKCRDLLRESLKDLKSVRLSRDHLLF